MNRTQSLNKKLYTQQVAPREATLFPPGRVEVRARLAARAARRRSQFSVRWVFFLVVVVLTFIFCATLDVKTRLEMYNEQQQQTALSAEIKQLRDGNTALNDELSRLENDSATIERVARQRLSMVRANERIIVPVR